MNDLKFDPDYRVHPKESLKEFMDEMMIRLPLGGEQFDLVSRIMKGGYYDANEAAILGEITPFKREMWLALQNDYLKHLVENM